MGRRDGFACDGVQPEALQLAPTIALSSLTPLRPCTVPIENAKLNPKPNPKIHVSIEPTLTPITNHTVHTTPGSRNSPEDRGDNLSEGQEEGQEQETTTTNTSASPATLLCSPLMTLPTNQRYNPHLAVAGSGLAHLNSAAAHPARAVPNLAVPIRRCHPVALVWRVDIDPRCTAHRRLSR